MSLESTIRGVLTNKQAPKEITEAVKPEDKGEYDQEGDMAKTQLRGVMKDAEHMIKMFGDDDNLPEWVQAKIIKAADYLKSAHDYMMNKDEEVKEEWVCGKCNCDPCTCEENLQEGINQKKFAAGAKAMKAYAMKHGGVDKADFMKVADSLAKISRINLLQAGQELSRLNRLVDNQDTDVRERIYVELKKAGLVEALEEKTLTPAEKKKREEIAKAIERENPDMPMPQKMAIATAQAKKTAEAYDEPQGQAKRMMSPLQKARMDKEKADRDRDGKLKPGVTKEEVELEEAKKVTSMQIHKVLAKTKNSREGIAALKKAFRVSDMEAKKMLSQVMNEATVDTGDIEKKKNISKSDKDKLGAVAKMMNREKAMRHMELAKKARADGDHDKANKHTQIARSLQKESTFVSKFKEELKEKKRGMSETKAAPKGYHFTKDGKLKKGDADVDGPGGEKLRADPLDKQRNKIPPLPEQGINRPAPRPRPSFPGTKKPRPFGF